MITINYVEVNYISSDGTELSIYGDPNDSVINLSTVDKRFQTTHDELNLILNDFKTKCQDFKNSNNVKP